MTYQLNSTSIEQKNAEQNRPIYLYIVYDYDGASNDVEFAAYDADVTFDGVVYTAWAITHDAVNESSSGEVTSVKLTIGNVNRVFQAYLEDYDLRGKKVLIRRVWSDQLADADACEDQYFYIDSYTADEQTIILELSGKYDVMDMVIPRGVFNRNHCRWVFKSTECGYSGGETTCNRTFQRCIALSNYARFGGFPAIPTSRVIGV